MPDSLRGLILGYGSHHRDLFAPVLREIRIHQHHHVPCQGAGCRKYECRQCMTHTDGIESEESVQECDRCLRMYCDSCALNVRGKSATNTHSSAWFDCGYCDENVCARCMHRCSCNYQYFDGSCKGCTTDTGVYYAPFKKRSRYMPTSCELSDFDDDCDYDALARSKRSRMRWIPNRVITSLCILCQDW
jgi:hypothetical protein